MFLVNHVFTGMRPFSCKIKRALFRAAGFPVGTGTTIVSPVNILGTVEIGENCWINRGFTVHGNGHVKIGNRCDIAPDVTFLTGGHKIGGHERRAGTGESYQIVIGDGCWIGAKSTILRDTKIGDGCVVAACSCVLESIPEDTLAGGIPAKRIRSL